MYPISSDFLFCKSLRVPLTPLQIVLQFPPLYFPFALAHPKDLALHNLLLPHFLSSLSITIPLLVIFFFVRFHFLSFFSSPRTL
jgi:hypothetical protein